MDNNNDGLIPIDRLNEWKDLKGINSIFKIRIDRLVAEREHLEFLIDSFKKERDAYVPIVLQTDGDIIGKGITVNFNILIGDKITDMEIKVKTITDNIRKLYYRGKS